jgi:hypothetical protein
VSTIGTERQSLGAAPALGGPWYRQFWPWFLIGLPALGIAVSLLTLVLAIGNADSLVGDDWYKRGLAINQDLDRSAAAARLGVTATVTIDADRGELVVVLDGDPDAKALAAELQHPTMQTRDRAYVLAQSAPGTYRAALGDLPAGRWYVALEPVSGAWRLAAPLRLAPGVPVRLAPTG